jgi:hypothetical protein
MCNLVIAVVFRSPSGGVVITVSEKRFVLHIAKLSLQYSSILSSLVGDCP